MVPQKTLASQRPAADKQIKGQGCACFHRSGTQGLELIVLLDGGGWEEGAGRERERSPASLTGTSGMCLCFPDSWKPLVPVLCGHMTVVLHVQPERTHTVGRLWGQNTESLQALLGHAESSQGLLSPVQAEEGQCVG